MRVEAGGVPVTLVCSRAFPKGCRQRFVDGRLKPHDVGLAISLLHFLRIESLKLLDDRPVRQHISGQVDFMFGAVDKPNVDMFEVFRRRVVNYGAGSARHGAREASKRTAVRNTRNRLNVTARGPNSR